MSKSKKSLADKFNTHFDRDWGTQKSLIREVRTARHNYLPTYSWDAMSDDPRVFSKLNADQLPNQPTRPCTLSGNRVIELEYSAGLGVFNVAERPVAKNELPLAPHQEDIGMIGTDLSGRVPMKCQAEQEGKVVVMKNHYGFDNYSVKAPKYTLEEVPEFYRSAGPMADQKLLTPAERRKIMEFDAQKQAAHTHIQEAIGHRAKLREKLNGPTHHRGVLMYDATDNTDSAVYAEQARLAQERHMRSQKHAASRQEHLQKCGGHFGRDFGDLIPAEAPQTDIFQSKKTTAPGRLSLEQTQDRVFQKTEVKVVNPLRTQHLRDHDLLGKSHNIVSGVEIEHWPSRIQHESKTHSKHKLLRHPSQESLHSTRNMQGSLSLF